MIKVYVIFIIKCLSLEPDLAYFLYFLLVFLTQFLTDFYEN